MSPYPSSRAQAAREELAARLRELRLDAGLTGRDMAARTGWQPSKVSRLENGKTAPSDEDIGAWCAACGSESLAADLIAASRTADSMYMQWKRLQRTGLRRLQESRVPLYERTDLFRVYSSSVMPGLVQTDQYAHALLTSITQFHGTPDDVTDAVSSRMERSRTVREGNHRIALIIEESVLRHVVGGAETMAGQLGFLLAATALPSVSLGVVPAGRRRDMWTLETFNIFDEERVHVELLTAAVSVTAPNDVAQYINAFAEMAKVAVYGSQARALITSAVDALD
ncbi:transcriptional regulator [Streptomyces agglomeratus]|uniref:helix-turn-helix domain-containing protein n=1 Tax=Streptomyces agglomeratus TaxID=285458 RepID=UPI00086EE1B0|nr:helix-turn-helix transcriptional regulator [Streptomyces agglomeratus]OEJ57885.1 transcriptional regulator [Streptomyces agglomeratus]